ncbi:MAG: zinc-binding dehydrogenase [Vicinamibacterales bacterium]
MKTTAAVLVETGRPLEIVELGIPALKPGQTIVEFAYSGVCHTQLLESRGYRGEDKFLPHLLGHEGAGTVVEVAPGVSKVAVGQQVIVSWIKGLGADVPGTVYDWDGRKVNAGAVTTFNRHAVISENRLTPLPAGLPLRPAALIGCAIPTGFGAVMNVLRPQAGQSAAVFGTGGVGLCAVAAAAMSGCAPVIAIDLDETKLALAKQYGATHVINAASGDVVAAVKAIVPGGVDLAVEATGLPAVMRDALTSVRAQGGAAVVVGNAHHGRMLELDPKEFNQGKRLLGTWGGDSVPDRDYPRYARLMTSGRFDPEPLLAKSYSLGQANEALEALETGGVARPLIDFLLSV